MLVVVDLPGAIYPGRRLPDNRLGHVEIAVVFLLYTRRQNAFKFQCGKPVPQPLSGITQVVRREHQFIRLQVEVSLYHGDPVGAQVRCQRRQAQIRAKGGPLRGEDQEYFHVTPRNLVF